MATKKPTPDEDTGADDDKTQKTDQPGDVQAPPADGDELPIPTEIQE